MSATILIVEDEPAIAANVEYALRTDGFRPLCAALGAEALEILRRESVDAVILDVGLPDANGFELCKQIRAFSQVPIVFVTARSDEVDRIVGLEIGADDYVVKPFSPRELVARVRTILRRAQRTVEAAPSAEGWFAVDDARARIAFLGAQLDLTRFEYVLLKTMLTQPERVFSRGQLMQLTDAPGASMERTVDTHIKSLRAKLRAVNESLDPIQTHRGLGYSVKVSAP
jgi:two-component system, OmpR family, catabolic regulation response regulator CreB